MLTFLKFLYSWLLPPGLFVFAFIFAFAIFRKTKSMIWFVFSLLLMYLLSISAVTDYLIRPLEIQYPQPSEMELHRAQAQAIVVLGGGVTLGAPDINGKGQISNCSANRYWAALRLHRRLNLPIVISGTEAEAVFGYRLLKDCGVDEKYLLKEACSFNTADNAKFTQQLCEKQGFRKVVLVTAASHLSRSVMLFKREGVNVIPFPVDYRAHARTYFLLSDFTPSYRSMSNASLALKEYLGKVAVKMGW